MKFKNIVAAIGRGENAIIRPLSWVARGLLFIMMVLVTANVVGRFVFNAPVLGAIEIVELMMVVIAMFAIPYTTMKRGHVRIDVITDRFPRRVQAALASFAFLLSAGVFAAITYQTSLDAIHYTLHPELMTSVLFIPFAPFKILLALGSLMICVRLLLDVFQPLEPEEARKGGTSK